MSTELVSSRLLSSRSSSPSLGFAGALQQTVRKPVRPEAPTKNQNIQLAIASDERERTQARTHNLSDNALTIRGEKRLKSRRARLGDWVERTSQQTLDRISYLGSWWKGVKRDGKREISTASTFAGIATSPDGAYGSYLQGAGIAISRSDKIPLDEGLARVPNALNQSSHFSRSMGKLGVVLDATTGALDMMEAVHDEGGWPGKKTIKTTCKTLAQITLAGAAAKGVFLVVGASGLGIVGAPLIFGTVAAVGAGYAVGKALDWLAEDK